jgi:cytidylate kinase
MGSKTIPKLITFDGEARSGKGTIVQATKDFLRDEHNYNVMLIDRGQTFRTLVVAAARLGVNLDDAAAIDAFLDNPDNIASCTQFVKDVYHMAKDERDSLLYTNEVGENSAKIGARPASQAFVVTLTKKWMHDAADEAFDVVLLDGRALEAIAREMHAEKLCDYVLGLYFICDETVGARRTLGFASTQYDDLAEDHRAQVNEFVAQIKSRNKADMTRDVERLVRPEDAPTVVLPDSPQPEGAHMYIVDTTAEMTKREMYEPISRHVADVLNRSR